jgi:hypothetical protein
VEEARAVCRGLVAKARSGVLCELARTHTGGGSGDAGFALATRACATVEREGEKQQQQPQQEQQTQEQQRRRRRQRLRQQQQKRRTLLQQLRQQQVPQNADEHSQVVCFV